MCACLSLPKKTNCSPGLKLTINLTRGRINKGDLLDWNTIVINVCNQGELVTHCFKNTYSITASTFQVRTLSNNYCSPWSSQSRVFRGGGGFEGVWLGFLSYILRSIKSWWVWGSSVKRVRIIKRKHCS